MVFVGVVYNGVRVRRGALRLYNICKGAPCSVSAVGVPGVKTAIAFFIRWLLL